MPTYAAPSATLGSLVNPTCFWVDPVNGNDFNYGTSPYAAFKTIAAAFAAMPASGGSITLQPGTHIADGITAKPNVLVRGQGIQNTLVRWTATTGYLFNLAGCGYTEWRDFSLVAAAQKTAGGIFDLSAGSLHHRFSNLVFASPYQGIVVGGSCGDVAIDNISVQDLNATWPWSSFLTLQGLCTSVQLDRVRGTPGTAGMTNGFIFLTGTPSSVNISNVIVSQPVTGTAAMVGLNITQGQYVYVFDSEFESGLLANACTISGGNFIHLHNDHFLGLNGVVVSGTPNHVDLVGGEVIKCQQHGIDLQGGDHIAIRDAMIVDPSQATTNTYDGVHVAAGVSRFKIGGSYFGSTVHGNGNTSKYGIEVAAGASDWYDITYNQIENFGTANLIDGGTGTHKNVTGNQ